MNCETCGGLYSWCDELGYKCMGCGRTLDHASGPLKLLTCWRTTIPGLIVGISGKLG